MSKKRGCNKVVTRAPRFREDTPFMKAHETMVDFLKGNVTNSVMDMLGSGIFGFLQNLELNEDRDLIYSDDEDDNFNQPNEAQVLKPHPRIQELGDKEADRQKSIEEEEKRKSKTVKNKRKKMRKREKKRQEREEEDKKPQDEEEKSFSSESEETNNNYKEFDKSITNLSDEPINLENNKSIEESPLSFNKTKDDPLENLDPKKTAPCITEPVSEKKTKNKLETCENTQSPQNKNVEKDQVKQIKKENPVEDKSVKAEKQIGAKVSEIQKEENLDNKKEMENPIVDEHVRKSREMAVIGNHLAASGQYEMAIKCFTEAIKFTPKEYKIFGNRSFCFEKMQQFEEALSDAEVSLSLQPNWTKGLFRKGKALCGLKKYYEASLTFSEVLKMESTSQEASMELKRAQTLHLMEMGFTWSQCTNALKSHSTLEEAIDALFTDELKSSLQENGACRSDPSTATQSSVKDWSKVPPATKPKQQTKDIVEPMYPPSKKQAKPGQLFPVWVGSLSSTVDYVTLHEVFSRVGKVFSIKMVLEHHYAFVNYTSKTECDRAVQLLNGFLLEGCPLSVRYPSRIPLGIGVSKDAQVEPRIFPCVQKECFFWRTTGCTKEDCTFKHIPKNKGIDQEKFGIKNQF